MSQVPDFSHLQKLEVSRHTTAEYEFIDLRGNPTLTVVPATEANQGYFGTLLKRNKTYARRLRSQGMTRELLQKNRNEDRELYAKFVVKGWRGIRDADGADVPFSPEACREFFNKLPDHMFDDVRAFCAEPSSFIEIIDDEEVEELGEASADGSAGS